MFEREKIHYVLVCFLFKQDGCVHVSDHDVYVMSK